MLGRISGVGAGALLNFIRSATRQPGSNAAPIDAAPVDAGPRSADRSKRAQDAIEALNTLTRAVSSQKQQRKAAAKAKVERLKAELDNLRLMSGGDPKAVARRAAQIARELASAAKEYAASGSSGMAAGGSVQAGGGADASASPDAGQETEDAEAAAGDDDTQAQAEAKGAEAEADAAAAKLDQSAQSEKGAKAEHAESGQEEKDADGKPLDDEGANKLAVETFQQLAGEVSRQGGEKKADSDFAAEVRRLMALAKSIVAQQRRRAEQQSGQDQELDHLAKQVRDAESDMEQSFSAASETPAMPLDITI